MTYSQYMQCMERDITNT